MWSLCQENITCPLVIRHNCPNTAYSNSTHCGLAYASGPRYKRNTRLRTAHADKAEQTGSMPTGMSQIGSAVPCAVTGSRAGVSGASTCAGATTAACTGAGGIGTNGRAVEPGAAGAALHGRC